jgi:transposase
VRRGDGHGTVVKGNDDGRWSSDGVVRRVAKVEMTFL